MAVFPFTVRATDSEGSYADRQFSITVRNSRVERFMVLNANDAFTSPDGTSWTRRVGQGGKTCAYGNGFWLILDPTVSNQWAGNQQGLTIRKSTDGINYQYIAGTSMTFLKSDGTPWVAASFPYLFNGNSGATKMVFWNGRFWFVGFGNTLSSGTSANSMILWSSPDGVTWTSNVLATSASAGVSISPNTYTSQYSINISDGVMIIPATCTSQIAANSAMGWITSDGATFTPIKNGATANTVQQFSMNLTRINGLYLSMFNHTTVTNTTNYQFSTDGLNWTTATLPANPTGASYPNQFFYMNGLVYSFMMHTSNIAAASFYYSSDAINWTIGQFQGSQGTSSSSSSISYVAKNGLLIAVSTKQSTNDTPNSGNTNQSNGVRVSTDGLTFTSVSLPGLFGNDILDIGAMS